MSQDEMAGDGPRMSQGLVPVCCNWCMTTIAGLWSQRKGSKSKRMKAREDRKEAGNKMNLQPWVFRARSFLGEI